MSKTTHDKQFLSKPNYQIVDGFPIPVNFQSECFQSAMSYKPRDDDIFLVTYPKCGMTWANQMLMLILNLGKIQSPLEFNKFHLFLDNSGAEAAQEMPSPCVIKSHLPFRLIPRSEKTKYISIARNPKDCCVSYFHHIKERPGHDFNGTFDDFFEAFLAGDIDFGDYFEHLLGWYENRNNKNVLFLTYEDMQEDLKSTILKMASFIDDILYAEPLRKDSEKLNTIIKYSSFRKMKEKLEKDDEVLYNMSEVEIQNSDLPRVTKKRLLWWRKPPNRNIPMPTQAGLLRKGIIGDWKNYFSQDQDKRMNEKFSKRTKGTDIPDLWEKYL